MGHAFLLTLEFNGAGFCGWQRQREGHSVQGTVEAALERLAGSPVKAVAAGRTDSGVHAVGMPVTTTMPEKWHSPDLLRALNAVLPPTIAVRAVRQVKAGTCARRSAAGRRYRYDIGTDGTARSPFRSGVEWPLARQLDLGVLRRSASVIHGEHDFVAFAAVGEPKPHYRCKITEADWQQLSPGQLRFTIAADRFLHHMVRFLVGTMVEVGLGRREEGLMSKLLLATDNHSTPAPAPPQGLFFLSAGYPEEIYIGEAATW